MERHLINLAPSWMVLDDVGLWRTQGFILKLEQGVFDEIAPFFRGWKLLF